MSEVLTAVGTCVGIEEKPNGWIEVKVGQPGKQYPLKLATKRSSLVDQVRELKGAVGTFSYKETESERINENTGRPYTNRYLEGVEAGAASDSGTSGTTASGNDGGKENVDWDAKERRDFRSRAWAVTVSAFQHTIRTDEAPLDVFNRLRPFQQAMYADVVRELDGPKPQAQAEPIPAADEPPYDDDIPF